MKKVIVVGVVLVAAIAVGAALFYLVSNLNSLIAGVIEKNGSEVTETSVSVSGVDVSLREGRGSIQGLRIASPEGFQARDAFSLGDITVDIDVASVREDPIVIEEVRILAPVINAEFTSTGSSNVNELRDRVQAYSGGSKEKTSEESKNIRIKKFVFEQGRVEVDATALGLEKRSLDLPEIRLTNVGGSQGAPPDEIAKQILTAVAKQVSSEIAHSEVDRLIKDQLGGESITEKASGLLDKIGN